MSTTSSNSQTTSSPKFTNRLINEKSPYLLQHAHNPVDWYPWGEEAFRKARETQLPIFLSIGYSCCHWCHEMEVSFNDPAIAEIMNKNFVSIKVDREERPDVDRVYMQFVTATTGHGGWPLSVWLTPDLHFIFGGTYYPPEDRWGSLGFPSVLKKISHLWSSRKDEIVNKGKYISEMLSQSLEQDRDDDSTATATGTGLGTGMGSLLQQPSSPSSFSKEHSLVLNPVKAREALEAGFQKFEELFDAEHGGFGDAPKFPRPTVFNFLYTMYVLYLEESQKLKLQSATGFISLSGADKKRLSADERHTAHALKMCLVSLDAMYSGGLYDHIGGGFHRYSVDEYWHVPHFEKMLYDQSQLVMAYTTAYQLTHNSNYEQIVRDTLAYVLRELTSVQGAFLSAEDADSLPTATSSKKKEGAYYTWTYKEIVSLLDDSDGDTASTSTSTSTTTSSSSSSSTSTSTSTSTPTSTFTQSSKNPVVSNSTLFNYVYDIKPNGNIRRVSDPHGDLIGLNHLYLAHTLQETADHFQLPLATVVERVETCRQRLFGVRSVRPRPHLDDKVIAAWNGYMLSALTRAGGVFREPLYIQAARKAANFIIEHMIDKSTGQLVRTWRDGAPSTVGGFLSDYAAVIQGLLDLYDVDGDVLWLQWSTKLLNKQIELFYDSHKGGFFTSSTVDPNIILKMKIEEDNAEPAGNSLSVLNLLKLAHITSKDSYKEMAIRTLATYEYYITKAPTAVPLMLTALQCLHSPIVQVIIVGKEKDSTAAQFSEVVLSHYMPFRVVIHLDDTENGRYLWDKIPSLEEFSPLHGKTTAYVCKDYACLAPITTVEELEKALGGSHAVPMSP